MYDKTLQPLVHFKHHLRTFHVTAGMLCLYVSSP